MAALLVLATICHRPVTLTFDLLTLKSVWESHVTCAKFRLPRPFGFLVRDDVRESRQTDRRTTDADHRIMPPRRGHNNNKRTRAPQLK